MIMDQEWLPQTTLFGSMRLKKMLLYYDGPRMFIVATDLGNFLVLEVEDTSDDMIIYTCTKIGKATSLTGPLIDYIKAASYLWVAIYENNEPYHIVANITSELPTKWLPKPGASLI